MTNRCRFWARAPWGVDLIFDSAADHPRWICARLLVAGQPSAAGGYPWRPGDSRMSGPQMTSIRHYDPPARYSFIARSTGLRGLRARARARSARARVETVSARHTWRVISDSGLRPRYPAVEIYRAELGAIRVRSIWWRADWMAASTAVRESLLRLDERRRLLGESPLGPVLLTSDARRAGPAGTAQTVTDTRRS